MNRNNNNNKKTETNLIIMVIRNNCNQFLMLLSIAVQLLVSLKHISCENVEIGSNMIKCFENERQALLRFKGGVVDDYDRLSTWGIEEDKRDCCKWRGVRCHNRTNHVMGLDLRGPSERRYRQIAPLRGNISSSLLELQHLNYLDLSLNEFNPSPIPEFIGTLSKLRYLNLSNGYFFGQIPKSIGNLSSLVYLDLEINNIYSENLDWVSHLHSLEYLGLSYVNLSTATNWLQTISKLTSVKELYLTYCRLPNILPFSQYSGNVSSVLSLSLARNNLNGQLSELIINLFGAAENKLQYLDLSNNNITGSLPDFSRFSFLRELVLGGNKLNGIIPEGFLKLPILVLLHLGENQFTGPMPDLSFSSSLKELYLYNNMFNGTLNESIGRLSELEILSLYSNNLEGVITEAYLFNLSRLSLLDLAFNFFLTINLSPLWVPPFQLRYVSLSRCKLGAQFPSWLRTQKEVFFLDISEANIVDSFPSWFSEISHNLIYLNASGNQIHGVFPNVSISDDDVVNSFASSPYRYSAFYRGVLDISRNRISGSVSFLCNSKSWNFVDLSDNLFSGQLPDCFWNCDMLDYLNLANNNFLGKIPSSIGSAQQLTWLRLRNNSFSGELPTSMSNLRALNMLDLAENRLTGNIPAWLELLAIQVLSLSSNGFSGSMPLNICDLRYTQILDFSSNMISGAIPKCLKNLSAMTEEASSALYGSDVREGPVTDGISGFGFLTSTGMIRSRASINLILKGQKVDYTNTDVRINHIDFSNNLLSGKIPDEITKLVGLLGMNFSRNNLTGSIPQDIGELKYLNSLDLSRNHLSGSIPTSLSDLSHLGFLNLSYNNLSGRVPVNSHMLTVDESAYIGNPGLCGRPVLNKSCPGDNETPRVPDFVNGSGSPISSNLDDADEDFISLGFFISFGFGFIVGFWGIIGTILLSKSFRYALFKMTNGVVDYIYLRIVLNKARLQRYIFTHQ